MAWQRWCRLTVPITANVLYLAVFLQAQTRAYVTNPSVGDVSVIDLTTNAVVTTVPTGFANGIAITPDGSRVYAANLLANTVTVIDTSTNTVTATITGVPGNPYLVAVSPDGKTAYVTNSSSAVNTVSVIDTATNTIRGFIMLGNGAGGVIGVAVAPDGSRLYVAGNANVFVVDTFTNAVVATILGVGNNIYQIAVSPDGSRLYAASRNSGLLSVINTVTAARIAGLAIGNEPLGVVVLPTGNKVYASTGTSGTVAVVDAATNAVIHQINIGGRPVGLATNLGGTRVYVTNTGLNVVSIIDTATDTVVGQIPTVDDPEWIATITPAAVTPPSCTLKIDSIQPTSGGNAGTVSPLVEGCAFASGATAKLTQGGQPDIVGTSVTVDPTGKTLRATFDLTGSTPSSWNLVVMNPNGTSVMLPNGFTVEQGGAPDVWVDLVGWSFLRAGTPQTYFIVYGNRGSVDSKIGETIWASFPSFLGYTATQNQLPGGSAQVGSNTILFFQLATPIAAGSTGVLDLILTAPDSSQYAHQPFQVLVWQGSH